MKIVFATIMLAGLFLGFYISIFSVLIPISDSYRNDHTFISEFLSRHLFVIALIVTIFLLMFFIFIKRQDFIKYTGTWLTVLFSSLFIAGIFAYIFGNSSLWFLKYTIGFVIGTIAYLLNRRHLNIQTTISTAIISFLALFFCENMEYYFVLDPPSNPSTMYIHSFPNKTIWLIFILFVVVPATLISKGLIINKLFRPNNERDN